MSAFKTFFEHTVWQCVTAGLVDGKKLFVDSSLIDADASNNSVVDTENLKRHLNKGYRRLEQRLDDLQDHNSTPANSRHISTTDPDASVIRHGRGRSKLRYKIHRGGVGLLPSAWVMLSQRLKRYYEPLRFPV